MDDITLWFVARSTGFVALGALCAAALGGMLLRSRIPGLRPPVLLEVHRTATFVALGALAVHGITLALDTTLRLPLVALVAPGTSTFRPVAVGLGVAGGEIALLVTASFWARRRIGMRAWRALHWTSYAALGLSIAHGVLAGSDSGTLWARAVYVAAAAIVVGGFAFRLAAAPEKGARRDPAVHPKVAARREQALERASA